MEIVIVSAIIIFVLVYNQTIDGQKFLNDNAGLFEMLKEDDYEFLVYAKYGEEVDVTTLFNKRIQYAFFAMGTFLFVFLNQLSLLNIVISVFIGYLVFKMPYSSLKSYYKKYMTQIDQLFFLFGTLFVPLSRAPQSAPA